MGQLTSFVPVSGRNTIINGAMAVSQTRIANANTSISLVAAGSTWSDVDNIGIQSHGMTTAVVNSSQRVDHPVIPNGFCKSIEVTTAEVAIAANEAAIVRMGVESNIAYPLSGQNAVLSFNVKSPKTGIHCVGLETAGGNFYYVAEYIIDKINTWEYKAIPIPQMGGSGGIGAGSGIGIKISFPLAAGANFQIAPNVWVNGGVPPFYATANQQNLLDTIGNTFRITEVQLEKGLIATPFEYVPFDQTLQRCFRYYWNTFTYGTVPAQNNGYIAGPFGYQVVLAGVNRYRMPIVFPTEMRVAPAVTFYNPFSANALWLNVSTLADSGSVLASSSAKGITLSNAQVAADAVGNNMNINAQFDARI